MIDLRRQIHRGQHHHAIQDADIHSRQACFLLLFSRAIVPVSLNGFASPHDEQSIQSTLRLLRQSASTEKSPAAQKEHPAELQRREMVREGDQRLDQTADQILDGRRSARRTRQSECSDALRDHTEVNTARTRRSFDRRGFV